MRTWMAWLGVVFAACGGSSGKEPSCDDNACATACTTAGFGSGTCAAGVCDCIASPPPPAGSGAIAGSALLFGHTAGDPAHDHAGITVAAAGTTFTTQTGADGSYSLSGIPDGVYALTFVAPKYVSTALPAVVVAGGTTTVAPTVTLDHGELVGPLVSSDAAAPAQVRYSPDRAHALVDVRYEAPFGVFTDTLAVFATDGSGFADVHTTVSPSGFVDSNTGITNDSVLFGDVGGLWARAVDGSAPPRLLIATPGAFGASLQLKSTTASFALVQILDPAQNLPVSWTATRTDGSGSIHVWTQGTPAENAFPLTATDDQIVFVVSSEAQNVQSVLHLFDMATQVDTTVPLTNLTLIGASPRDITPDGKWWLMSGQTISNASPRTFVWEVGTTNITIDPNPLLAGNVEVMADSSGFTFANDAPAAGGYFFWGTTVTPSPNPIQLIPLANNNGLEQIPTHLFGSVVTYADTANSQKLTFVTVPRVGALAPKTQVVDNEPGFAFFTVNGAELDAVWSAGLTLPVQWHGTSVPLPMTAAPTVATLGGPLPAVCSADVSATRGLSVLGSAFYYRCPDTDTLFRFSTPFASTGSASAVDAAVISLQSVGSGDVLYERGDATWWLGDGSGSTMVSETASTSSVFVEAGDWLLFQDEEAVARASRLDGTAIDEPLVGCELQAIPSSCCGGPGGEPAPELVGSALVAPTALCDGGDETPYVVPIANLP